MGKITTEIGVKIISLHQEGKLTKEINEILGMNLHWETIRRFLAKNGLRSNYWKRRKLKVAGGLGRCNVCGIWRDLEHFPMRQKIKKGYSWQRGTCSMCNNFKNIEAKNATIKHYLSSILSGRKYYAKKTGIVFDITKNDLEYIYNKQNGLCFYSDEQLDWRLGNGTNGPNAVSIDRVDITRKQYVIDNTVLCTKRMNAIKYDLTLEEMKKYTPNFYNRIINCEWLKILPN